MRGQGTAHAHLRPQRQRLQCNQPEHSDSQCRTGTREGGEPGRSNLHAQDRDRRRLLRRGQAYRVAEQREPDRDRGPLLDVERGSFARSSYVAILRTRSSRSERNDWMRSPIAEEALGRRIGHASSHSWGLFFPGTVLPRRNVALGVNADSPRTPGEQAG